MNYQQFIATIWQKTSALLGPEIEVRIHHTTKNNDTKRIGLTISQKDINISPTIYLEEFFQQYQKGDELDTIAEYITKLYNETRFQHSWDVTQLKDFESAKSKLAFKVIHHEKNIALLNEVPHVPYLDLAIVFYLFLESTEKGIATILITNDILNHWGISLEHLYQVAITNTPKLLPVQVKPMHEVICELMGAQESSENEENDSHLFVLTNETRHLGAACILYPHILEDIASLLGEDYYLLPSSIHEMIILPASYALSIAELREMIVEVNNSHVSREEILADSAYYYSRQENRLLPTLQ